MFPALELFILYSSMHLNCAFSFIFEGTLGFPVVLFRHELRQRFAFCNMRGGRVTLEIGAITVD